MRALFVCRDIYYFNYPAVADVLSRKYGVEACAITFSTKATSVIRKRYPSAFEEIFNMDDFFARNADFQNISNSEKVAYLSVIEKRFDIPSLFSFFYVDRLLQRSGPADAVTVMYGIAKFIEDFYTSRFDTIIGEIGTFFDNLLWSFSARDSRSYVFVTTARIKGKFIFIEAKKGEMFGLKAKYEHYKANGLTRDDEDLFEDFYRQFLAGRSRPEYTEKMQFIRKTANLVSVYRERSRISNKSRYILEAIDDSSLGQFVFLRLRRFLNRHFFYRFGNVFSGRRPSRYIYYPLHVDPEISTMLYGPYYTNQAALIENIARSIPVGHMLLVKEHPYMYGLRAPSFYREIRKLPNVVLLHPMADNYEVVRNADAVIVVTGTAGFEGILFEKPVFTLGEVFYNIYDLVYKIDNIKSMPEILRDGMARFRQDREGLKKFIVAYLKSACDGVIGNPLENRGVLDPENIDDIAAEIVRFHGKRI